MAPVDTHTEGQGTSFESGQPPIPTKVRLHVQPVIYSTPTPSTNTNTESGRPHASSTAPSRRRAVPQSGQDHLPPRLHVKDIHDTPAIRQVGLAPDGQNNSVTAGRRLRRRVVLRPPTGGLKCRRRGIAQHGYLNPTTSSVQFDRLVRGLKYQLPADGRRCTCCGRG